jgi:serine protease AprX
VTFTVNPPSQPDFALAVTPGAQTATGGQTVSYSVSTSALNGFQGSIGLALTGLPPGATGSFAPSSVAGGSGSTLSVSVPSTTPAGTYGLNVIGTSGNVTHSAGISLTVQASFSLWTDSTGYLVFAGDPNGASGNLESFALNGFSGTVALSASGQADGVDVSITPSSIDANGNAMFTLIASPDTPLGNYDMTITGTSGGLTETVSFTLTVCDISGICPFLPADQVGSTRPVAGFADEDVPRRPLV